eukprot:jgi/Psemu1/309612/fgenesh1_kg.534_\
MKNTVNFGVSAAKLCHAIASRIVPFVSQFFQDKVYIQHRSKSPYLFHTLQVVTHQKITSRTLILYLQFVSDSTHHY